MSAPRSGHRGLPHAADLRIAAWAPSRSECLREVMIGLVDRIADVAGTPIERTVSSTVWAPERTDAVPRVLDEIIYLLDVDGSLPADVEVTEVEDGYHLSMSIVAVTDIELSVTPKAVTLQDLRFEYDGTAWICAVTVDV